MTSTSLFDGYLAGTERPQNRRTVNQRRTESVASVSGQSMDDSSSSSHSPAPSMSRTRFGAEGEQLQQTRQLHVMEEEDEEERQDDDHTVVGSESDYPPAPQGAASRSGSAVTPTASVISFSESLPKQNSTSSRTAGSPRQPHHQGSSSTLGQSSRRGPQTPTGARIRHTPRLPNHTAEKLAPSTIPYWSKAPVYGYLPTRCMRAHTVTLIENVAWQIGGCDHQACSREVLTFDTETMQWAHPETVGDLPPACRAHSATQVDRRIFVFGGGEGSKYFNHLYVLDTLMRRWNKVTFPPGSPEPIPRRAHTTWYYQGKLYLFGGGNGQRALNDIWTYDVGIGAPYDKTCWEELEVNGIKPTPRGYHTANLVNNSVIVIGGSDGSACFDDIWVLNLEKLTWHEVKLDMPTKRLSHTSTQVGSYLVVMGGHDGSKYNHDLFLFNLVTLQWENKEARGRYPSSRGYHATLLYDSRLFVIGGFDGHAVFDDVYILDLAASAYLPQVKSFDLTLN